jgi:hypothetical protein
MASNIITIINQYNLRSSSPVPVSGGDFVLQTFMAERSDVYSYLYTEELPKSKAFRGRGGLYMSAQFNRLSGKDGISFQGKIVGPPEYVDEDDIKV